MVPLYNLKIHPLPKPCDKDVVSAPALAIDCGVVTHRSKNPSYYPPENGEKVTSNILEGATVVICLSCPKRRVPPRGILALAPPSPRQVSVFIKNQLKFDVTSVTLNGAR